MKKLYIGCALTNIPAEKRDALLGMISEVKKELGKTFELLEFKGVADIGSDKPLSPQDIYNFDIKECVMKADYMLAICDFPSLGLGYEISVAVEKMGIPVLAIAQKGANVTRLIRGIDHKNFKFEEYEAVEDIVKKVLETFK